MIIVADENISLVNEAFGSLGEVRCLPAKAITHTALADADMLLVRSVTKVDRPLVENTPIRFVATATVGFDHVDTTWLHDSCIGFGSAPGSNAEAVAEYVATAIMLLCRKFGKEPSTLTLGIIGVGNVGSHVLRHARTLGMKCLMCDPPRQRQTGSDVYVPRSQLLAQADIITLHVPLTMSGEDSTYHLVNHDFLSAMKQDAWLINTSRGKVVDEKGLRAERDRLGSVVLDVWDNEPAISVESIKSSDIATPHIAGYSHNGKARATEMIYRSACAFYFKETVWKPDRSHWMKELSLDLSASEDPLLDAMATTVPLGRDDSGMRGLLKLVRDHQSARFEELRRTYPHRSEFSDVTVTVSKKRHMRESLLLKDLGFRTLLA